MSDAKWKLMVDWSGDGEFAGADDDVTGATQGLSLRHMRELTSERIGAARLDFRLTNDDHKYSPPNAASPLFGLLRPGRKVWLRAAFPCDEFGAAVGTSLANHAPKYGAAYRWTTTQPGFRIGVSGGLRTEGSGSGRRIATMDFGLIDASIGCEFTRGGDATLHGGLTIRYADTNNFLYASVTPDGVEARKVERGRDTLLARASLRWGTGERRFLQASLHGGLIRVFVNQRQVMVTQSDFNTDATRHGLYCDGATTHVWEEFGGWASLFYGDLERIDPQPGAAQCRIRAYDEMRRMKSVTLYMYATSSFPQTSDEALGDILDYAGVDAAFRRMDRGRELVPQLWSPPLWGVRAVDEIWRLQDEEDGFVYLDGHGCWQLEGVFKV